MARRKKNKPFELRSLLLFPYFAGAGVVANVAIDTFAGRGAGDAIVAGAGGAGAFVVLTLFPFSRLLLKRSKSDDVVAPGHRVADFFARWVLTTLAVVLVLLLAGVGWGIGAAAQSSEAMVIGPPRFSSVRFIFWRKLSE